MDSAETSNMYMCRSCLATEGNFVSLNSSTEEEEITFFIYWNYSTKFEILSEEQLPEYLCWECSVKLKEVYNFLKRAEQSNMEMRKFLRMENIASQEELIMSVENYENIEQQQHACTETGEIIEKLWEIIENDNNSFNIHTDISNTPQKTEILEFKNEMTCAQCYRIFRKYSTYEDHMYAHRGMRPYRCEICKEYLQSNKLIIKHYLEVHNVEPTMDMIQPKGDKEFIRGSVPNNVPLQRRNMCMCAKCKYEDENTTNLLLHLHEVHNLYDETYIIKKLPYQCPKCIRSFISECSVYAHIENDHSLHSYSITLRKRKTRICTKCGKTLSCHALKVHEQKCINKTSYQCKLCQEIYDSRTKLTAHRKESHPSDPTNRPQHNYRCDICGNTYRTRVQLGSHIKRHEARNFSCNECSRKFITQHELNKHKLIHTDKLQYKCDICLETFRYTHMLTQHRERKHLNKIYRCQEDDCECEFETRAQLNSHKYKHIGNPYKCEYCPKEFFRREHFRRHLKAVHCLSMTEVQLSNMYQKHIGRYNKHDITKMSQCNDE